MQDFSQLAATIKIWGEALGFQQIGICDTDLSNYEPRLLKWLENKFHGTMHYMEKHGIKRTRPALIYPNTLRIISVRLDYLPADPAIINVLQNKNLAYISRYALGRDYHKIMRKKLKLLAGKIRTAVNSANFRVFCDSAPVLEKAIAEKAGLGFIGKHTNLINPKGGSWFFLGEIYTNLPLPIDKVQIKNHCGSCTACIAICPTEAIIAPYQLDARRCISYLTIESKEAIPVIYRPLIGNRIYGCDDCQLVCPWNKFAKFTNEQEFHPRQNLHAPELLTLFAWTEKEFLKYTEGSAIRRIGHQAWQRNIAVALGNATPHLRIINILQKNLDHPSLLVREHIEWALAQQLKSIKLR